MSQYCVCKGHLCGATRLGTFCFTLPQCHLSDPRLVLCCHLPFFHLTSPLGHTLPVHSMVTFPRNSGQVFKPPLAVESWCPLIRPIPEEPCCVGLWTEAWQSHRQRPNPRHRPDLACLSPSPQPVSHSLATSSPCSGAGPPCSMIVIFSLTTPQPPPPAFLECAHGACAEEGARKVASPGGAAMSSAAPSPVAEACASGKVRNLPSLHSLQRRKKSSGGKSPKFLVHFPIGILVLFFPIRRGMISLTF